MGPPEKPYQPYAAVHETTNGPGDARPDWMQVLKDCDAIGKLKGKTVLITGCSAGLGVETAKAMYETGATCFFTARDMKKLDGIIEDIVKNAQYNKEGPKPQPIEMHLDSLDSVRKGAEDFKQKSGGKLNILINNAGVMAAPYGTTKDGLETQIGVNHFAHFLLFQLLKPLLLETAKKEGTTSRLINLSSAGHRMGTVQFSNKAELDKWNSGENYNKWTAYGQAKTANILMANMIDRKYGSQNLHGLSVHPGGILTDLARHLTEEDFKMFDNADMQKAFKNPAQGASTTVWAAVSPHFEGGNGGRYLMDVGECGPMQDYKSIGAAGYAKHAHDEKAEEALWKVSCEVVVVPED